ncbi:hypothetical protein JCM18899A_45080 [Nocardioides sp. AN3]
MAAVATGRGRTNLPAELTSFVGRRRELADIRDLMAASRLVTLTGMGGVGKTRLARHAAESSSRAFADGVWLVELADLVDSALLGDAIATTLGLRQQGLTWTLDALARALGHRHSLLILDNCEHLVEACAAAVDAILKRCPDLHVLATSREALGIAGERVYPVAPLPLPEPGVASVEALNAYEAVSLFVDRATAVSPSFVVDAANVATVAELCAQLEGVPLALELAAVWTRVLAPRDLLAQLGDHYELVDKGLRATPTRQQSLRALVGWSYQLCDSDEQSVWRQAAVFAQGFELDALRQVVDSPSGLELLGVVDRLVSKSILFTERDAESVRFRMPEIIRSYGLARLAEADEELAQRRAHLAWCIAVAEQARREWVSPAQLAWFVRIRKELPNIRAALAFALSQPGGERDAVHLVATLTDAWLALGCLNEATYWLDQATERDLPRLTRLTALRTRTILAALQDDRVKLATTMEEAWNVASQGANATEMAWLTYAAALAATTTLDPTARDLMSSAVTQFREAGDLNGLIWALGDLALAEAMGGDPAATEPRVQEFLATAGPLGERFEMVYVLWARAVARWRADDRPGATRALQESLALSVEYGGQLGIGMVLEVQAWITAQDGDPVEAAELLGRAQAALTRAGTSLGAFAYLVDGHARCEAGLLGRIGARAFRAAFERGLQGYGPEPAVTMVERAPERATPKRVAGATTYPPLTRRESQVAVLVADGMSNREIAGELVISVRTVETHVENILVKLGHTSRGQIGVWLAGRR